MYNDYLEQKKRFYKYEEEYPRVWAINSAAPVLQQKTKSKRSSRVKQQMNSDKKRRNRYSQDMNIYLNRSHKQSKGLLNGANRLLKGVEDILKFALVIGLAFAGISKYLDSKESMYNPEYGRTKESSLSGMSSGKTSDKGIKAILNYEGFLPKAKDVEGKGIYTIGYGHRGKEVKPGQTITKDEAWKLFKSDLIPREDAVKKYVKVPISQNMFDALVSFVYNCGVENFIKSDTLKLLNQGKYKEAATRMQTEYINKGTIHEQGLRNRRKIESEMFSKDLDENGKLISQPVNNPVIRETNAGKLRRVKNSEKANVGNYKLYNPAETYSDRDYIDLSERAEAYLQDVGGKGGIVTSGAEGHDPNEKGISHGAGNKIDIQPFSGNTTNWNEWAELAIPFIKNKNTAFINFEDFTDTEFEKVKAIIFSKISAELQEKCKGKAKGVSNVRGKNTFIFNWMNPNHKTPARHLDIGILTTAYSEKQHKQELKEESKKTQKLENNNKTLNELKKEKPLPIEQKQSSNGNNSTIFIKQTPRNKNNLDDISRVDPARNQYNKKQAAIKKGKN